MNRPEIYKKSVDVLYKAYFDGTLEHQNCFACACGNLVAAACGYEYERHEPNSFKQSLKWKHTTGYLEPMYIKENWLHIVDECALDSHQEGEKQIKATGYTIDEFRRIERAFEKARKKCLWESQEEIMFSGLSAVLDILKEIHEVDDNQEDIKRFKKHYETLIA